MSSRKIILTLSVLLLQFGHISGQTFGYMKASSIDMYTNKTGISTIIKSLGDYTVVYNKDYGQPFLHTFFVYKSGFFVLIPLNVTFSTDFGSSEETVSYTCVVNDMDLFGDTCYFCGQMTVDGGAPLIDPFTNTVIVPRFQDYGFLGKFALMPDDSNYTIAIQSIDNTSNLTRLAVSHRGNDPNSISITAIGEPDGLPGLTCLVEVQYFNYSNTGYQWIYSIGYPTEHAFADQEQFEDVLVLTDGVITVSRRACDDITGDGLICFGDRHYEFLIYKSGTYGFSGSIDGLSLYFTKHDRHTWHNGSETMRLCNYKNNGFCLAYSTRYQPNSDTDEKHHLTYAFSNMYSIDSAIRFDCSADHHVRELSYNSYTDNLNLLCVDSLNSDGIIYMLPHDWWQWYVYDIISFKKPNHTFGFINNRQSSGTLDFVGYNKTNHTLCRYGQSETANGINLSSCFSKGNINHFDPYVEEFTITDINDKLDWYIYLNAFVWDSYNARCTTIPPIDNNCSTYFYNQQH